MLLKSRFLADFTILKLKCRLKNLYLTFTSKIIRSLLYMQSFGAIIHVIIVKFIISLTSIDIQFSFIPEDKTLHYCTDDDFLLIFLRPCKFYPQSAFELMKRVADFRNKHAALFNDLIPSDERDAIVNHQVINVLKNRDHKNRRVMIVQAGKTWDPSKVTSDQILRMLYIVHLLAIQEEETQVSNI